MSQRYLLYIAVVLLLPLQFGLNMALLNAPMDHMACDESIDCIVGWNPALPSSVYAIGGLVGSAITTLSTSKLGLDGSLSLSALLFQIGAIIFWFAHSQAVVTLSRVISGLGAGMAIVGTPLSINIFAPQHLRAFFGAQTQISTNIGIILAQLWGVLWAESHWRRIITASGLVASVSLAGTLYLQSTYQLRKSNPEPVALAPSISVLQLLRRSQYRRLLIIGVLVFVMQQLTGINAIILYGTRTLADVFPQYAKQVNLLVSLVNLGMTVLGAFFINQFGRKRLLVISLTLTGLFTSGLALALSRNWPALTVAMVLLAIASFAIGIGPIPFLYISEISPREAVNAAQSVGTVSSWLATFAVVAVFPWMQARYGALSFYGFGVCTLAGAVGGAFYLPADSARAAS